MVDGLAAQVARLDLIVLDDRGQLRARRPRLLGRHDDLEGGQIGGQLHRLAERDADTSTGQPPLVPEHDVLAFGLEAGRDVVLDAPFFYMEQVGEVGVEEQLQRAVGGLVAVVADDDVLTHPPPDVAMAEDQERTIGAARAGPSTQGKGRREGIEGLGLESLGRLAVDPQLEPRQEPGVAEEEAVGQVRGHVPGPAGDGERRALHQGDGADGAQHRHLAGVRPRFGHAGRTLTAQVRGHSGFSPTYIVLLHLRWR